MGLNGTLPSASKVNKIKSDSRNGRAVYTIMFHERSWIGAMREATDFIAPKIRIQETLEWRRHLQPHNGEGLTR